MGKLTGYAFLILVSMSCSTLPQTFSGYKEEYVTSGLTKADGIGVTGNLPETVFGMSVHLGDIPPFFADYAWNMPVHLEDGVWSGEHPLYMMPGQRLRAYAYLPYTDIAGRDSIMGISAPGEVPEIYYNAPADAEKHIDIMVASDIRNDGAFSLSFSHILAGLKFIAGKEFADGGHIDNILVQGAAGTGSYNMTSNEWSTGADTGTFMMSGINFPSDAAAMPGEFITDARFLFPPQTFSLDSGAAIIINVTDNGRIISGKIPLAGVSWDTGKIYTYAISYSGRRVSASMTESFRDWGSYDMDDRDIHM